MKDYEALIEHEELELKDAQKLEEEKQQHYKALVSDMKEQQELRDQLQQELQAAQLAAEKKKQEVHVSVAEINSVKADITRLEKDLADLRREKKISELIAKQTDYWDVLEMRIEQRRKDLTFGLEDIGGKDEDVKTAVERIKNITQRGGFSHQAVEARNGESIYNQYIRRICEISVDGGQISYELKQERINIIDRFLNQQTIRGLWN